MYRLENKKKKHWTINDQGSVMKPSTDESCFTELVLMRHLPPWASRTACTTAETGSQAGELSLPSFIKWHCRLQGMIWEWLIWDWSFCSFQTQCKALDAANYTMTNLCAAFSSSLPLIRVFY